MAVAKSGTWSGGRWVLAPSLVALEAEADRVAPGRSVRSDGSIGDHAHAVRKSDHNPQESGAVDYVDAIDITHDPRSGMDIHARLRTIAARRDPRVDYLISNGRIWSLARASEGWRPYTGSNPHTGHGHISVRDSGRHDTSPWFAAVPPFPTPQPPPDIEDDDMGEYLQGTPSGRILHVYGERWRHLSPPMWARRRFFGAKLSRAPLPDPALDELLADLIKDPT